MPQPILMKKPELKFGIENDKMAVEKFTAVLDTKKVQYTIPKKLGKVPIGFSLVLEWGKEDIRADVDYPIFEPNYPQAYEEREEFEEAGKDLSTIKFRDIVASDNPMEYLANVIDREPASEWRRYEPMIKKVEELTDGVTSDKEKFQKIATWVRDSHTYDSSMGDWNQEREDIISSFEKGGVCRHAAITTIAMLRLANIPARYVYSKPTEPQPPHVVVQAYVDGKWMEADPTYFGPGGPPIVEVDEEGKPLPPGDVSVTDYKYSLYRRTLDDKIIPAKDIDMAVILPTLKGYSLDTHFIATKKIETGNGLTRIVTPLWPYANFTYLDSSGKPIATIRILSEKNTTVQVSADQLVKSPEASEKEFQNLIKELKKMEDALKVDLSELNYYQPNPRPSTDDFVASFAQKVNLGGGATVSTAILGVPASVQLLGLVEFKATEWYKTAREGSFTFIEHQGRVLEYGEAGKVGRKKKVFVGTAEEEILTVPTTPTDVFVRGKLTLGDAEKIRLILEADKEKQEAVLEGKVKKLGDKSFRIACKRKKVDVPTVGNLVKSGTNLFVDTSILKISKAKLRLGLMYKSLTNTLVIKDASKKRKFEDVFTPTLETNIGPFWSTKLHALLSLEDIAIGAKLFDETININWKKAIKEDAWFLETSLKF